MTELTRGIFNTAGEIYKNNNHSQKKMGKKLELFFKFIRQKFI